MSSFGRDGTPADHFPALKKRRRYLEQLRDHHIKLGRRMVGEELYPPDLLFMGLLQRSLQLVDAALVLFDSWNASVLPVVLRMQIDNLIRLAYMRSGAQLDELTNTVLDGVAFRKMEDAAGQRLTDHRLVELAAPLHPWMPIVYERTSGWVHFSSVHLHHGGRVTEEGELELRAGFDPDWLPESFWAELLGAMTQATEEIFGYFELWAEHKKELPERRQESEGAASAAPSPSAPVGTPGRRTPIGTRPGTKGRRHEHLHGSIRPPEDRRPGR